MLYNMNLCFPAVKYGINLKSDQLDFLYLCKNMYYEFSSLDSKETFPCIVKIQFKTKKISAIFNGKLLYEQTYPQLTTSSALKCLSSLVRNLLRCEDDWIFLHGSIIQLNGKNLLFLGESGAGKTTLITYFCNQQNTIFISEDISIINGETLEIIPFYRPLFIRNQSFCLLKNNYGVNLSHSIYKAEYDRYLVFPEKFMADSTITLDACLILKLTSNTKTIQVNKYSTLDSQNIFVKSSYLCSNFYKNIQTSCLLANRLPIYQLQYYNLDATYDFIKTLVFNEEAILWNQLQKSF